MAALFLSGCGQKENIEEPLEKENIFVPASGLEQLWLDFKENMPEDRNVEEDFKNSEFMAEFSNFLNTRDSVEYSEIEMENEIGQGDLDFYETESGGWNIRVIGYNADLQNKAVTDVRVKNKYVFLQCWNETEFFCKDIFYCDYYYPMAVETAVKENSVLITVISDFSMLHPNPVNLSVWEADGTGINEYNAFETYENEGWKFTYESNMLNIEKLYDEGASFAEINGVSFIAEDGNITILSGDDRFDLEFNGEKYIIK